MVIDGLTQEQVEMLDKIWSLDGVEEFRQFYHSVPHFRQQQINTLLTLIIMADTDEIKEWEVA